MPFVLDSSIAVAWAFEDEATPLTERVLALLSDDVGLVTAIWSLEVANAILLAERRRRLQPAEVVRFMELIRQLPIQVDMASLQPGNLSILELARQNGLTTYDASFLELAVREGLPLATQDQRLRAAAERAGVFLV